jgi:hypothetical protein
MPAAFCPTDEQRRTVEAMTAYGSAVAASLLEIAEAAEQKSGYGGTHALPSELN